MLIFFAKSERTEVPQTLIAKKSSERMELDGSASNFGEWTDHQAKATETAHFIVGINAFFFNFHLLDG